MSRCTTLLLIAVAWTTMGCSSPEEPAGKPATTPQDMAMETEDTGTKDTGANTAKVDEPEATNDPARNDAAGGSAKSSGTAVNDLVARLQRDKERQESTAEATELKVPAPADVERALITTAQNFIDALSSNDELAAKDCFLSDDQVQELFTPTYAKLLGTTRGSLNFREWQKFQLQTANLPVSLAKVDAGSPAVADPAVTQMYSRPALFIDTALIDYNVDGQLFQMTLSHLVEIDGDWKFLSFKLVNPSEQD